MNMECINPQEIHEGDLLAYVDGAARPGVGEHIARCIFCRAEVAALQVWEQGFHLAFERTNCPETEVLLQYHMNMLPSAAQQKVGKHVKDCDACQVELTRFLPQLGEPSLIEHIQQTGRELIEAILQPLAMRPKTVFRGNASEEVYQAGDYQVVFVKEPPVGAENRWGLEGQVIQKESPTAVLSGQVSLWQAEYLVTQDIVDVFGYFALANVMAGSYTLRIELQTQEIIVSHVTIP